MTQPVPIRHTLTSGEADPGHDDCTVCGGEGTSLWFTPEGGEEIRPCTGIPYEDMLAAGLIRRGRRELPTRVVREAS